MLYDAERGDMAIAVVGDAMISRRMRAFRELRFLKLVDIIRNADVSIANLEFLFHDYESSWQWTRGTYTRSDPKNLNELKWMGFDAVLTANNHAYDFSEGGFLTTLRHLEEVDLPHAGGGKDLDRARAPVYVDSPRGRGPWVAASSTFTDCALAGPRSRPTGWCTACTATKAAPLGSFTAAPELHRRTSWCSLRAGVSIRAAICSLGTAPTSCAASKSTRANPFSTAWGILFSRMRRWPGSPMKAISSSASVLSTPPAIISRRALMLASAAFPLTRCSG